MWERAHSQSFRISKVLLYYDMFIWTTFTQISSSIKLRMFSPLDDVQLWGKYVMGQGEKWLRKWSLSDYAALIIYWKNLSQNLLQNKWRSKTHWIPEIMLGGSTCQIEEWTGSKGPNLLLLTLPKYPSSTWTAWMLVCKISTTVLTNMKNKQVVTTLFSQPVCSFLSWGKTDTTLCDGH
jgi:hypothetical protein